MGLLRPSLIDIKAGATVDPGRAIHRHNVGSRTRIGRGFGRFSPLNQLPSEKPAHDVERRRQTNDCALAIRQPRG